MTASGTRPFWVTVFIDLPAAEHDAAVRFWSEVTGWAVSEPRGEAGEFATLVPALGGSHVKVQRVGSGGGTHLDLHVHDLDASVAHVLELGGAVVERSPHGYVVATSPGGYAFCLVRHEGASPTPPVQWPGGHTSLLDQVCLDIPSDRYESELAFWSELTGWDVRPSATRREFTRLRRPQGQALHLLLQRLDDGSGPVRAHLDLASSDLAAEVRRHELLGATRHPDQRGDGWTVMRSPTGEVYCITSRDPETGLLP